ncbi:5'-methylthioadenosine/S-adenosylhomocysteine nucleosidase [Arcanobacterium phocisimile]|uniref:adenosylhomocysteine nucleosidase n=1 Tax=Arcanobacterium phocisimile TaxID=1302235 RepID=A0ABX7IIN6_9ACTO|nr:5'-methylthioadenosine/S-adenosylhomocysteine nucleosidase [Arcanobacterium phocisimile]QRV02851.1 5'-methylthioadenosine/S-adenosylhomocysteine nucleosidase [Arcanobacterium phocisimile]
MKISRTRSFYAKAMAMFAVAGMALSACSSTSADKSGEHLEPMKEKGHMAKVDALVVSAMDEEMAPFLEEVADYNPEEIESPVGKLYRAKKDDVDVLMVVTGIGMTADASVLSWTLAHYQPEVIVAIGSAGGMAADSRVGQVVVGTEYTNGGADGTVFGYVRGQVPGQPEIFTGDQKMITALETVAKEAEKDNMTVRFGQMLSSDAFITEVNVEDRREAFPAVVTADMESHAASQVAHAFGIPFVSIRAISDLCGKPDDQSVSFHEELDVVAKSSAHVAFEGLKQAGYVKF